MSGESQRDRKIQPKKNRPFLPLSGTVSNSTLPSLAVFSIVTAEKSG
jgi:hypothetical protein